MIRASILSAHHLRALPPTTHTLLRQFTTTPTQSIKQNPPRPKLPEPEIHEVFLCGSGPGGQKINKTHSAVQLKHIPTGIVVKYQDTRSREQNRKIARQLLAARVDEAQNGDMSRSKIVEREMARKRASGVKKSRRKYRALEEEKVAAAAAAAATADGGAMLEGKEECQERSVSETTKWQFAALSVDDIAGFVIQDDIPKRADKKSGDG